ncbi:MAG: hypothetical protein HETSPECPRED_002957 [Heterodermia speciosa]|uniref:Uncharacterized protein n=1 Tax=Heterodermia speciosa TaxID=116794 RepID=A0A8H3F1R2_9LECA|nr:MAG: hypothetical protein HETSPECPRED_002957 [Heterodermia speciosa]
MARKRIQADIIARQFVASIVPTDKDDGLRRGAWEKNRKDPRPEPEPEPPLNGPAYASYQPNAYNQNQQQQQQYSGPQYQTQQPAYYNANSYNAPNNPAGYGGQYPNNGGYAIPYSGQPSPPLAGQNQYGNYQNQQPQNSGMGSSYGPGAPGNYMPGQNTSSVPQGQSPFVPPQLPRPTTTGSLVSVAPPAPRYCSFHGLDRDWSCGQCQRLSY